MEKLIVTDCDGVLLEWGEHFHKWMKSRGHNRVPDNSYFAENHYEGMSRDQGIQHVTEFNASGWMMDLPAYRDARSGVARLVEAGYVFHVITAMGTDPYAARLRQINLDNIFGRDVFVEFTPLAQLTSKKAALEPYRGSGLPWIEDHIDNAQTGFDMGMDCYLMNHPHNQDGNDSGLKRVNCWNDICDLILH
jgi:hypothetical protein